MKITLRQAAQEAGIKYNTVLGRIHHLGWSREKALSVKPEDKPTLKQAAKRTGISLNTLKSRIYTYGWSKEKALTESVKTSC